MRVGFKKRTALRKHSTSFFTKVRDVAAFCVGALLDSLDDLL